MKPRLLDLFCGAGGAAMGYHRAGFEVVGVDIKNQPHYPFEFHQADALTYPLEGFDAYHASPPCQDYSKSLKGLVKSGNYPRLIGEMQSKFKPLPLWVIENVPGSPLPNGPTLEGDFGLMLCGTMFGLRRVYRHRLFLTSILIPRPVKDCAHIEYAMNPYKAKARERDGIQKHAFKHYGEAMEIDWMPESGIQEAIPPAYTEYIGKYLMAEVLRRRTDG